MTRSTTYESGLDTSYSRVLRITAPVMVAQLSHTLMGVIDTVMVGKLGVTSLAAAGLGNLVAWWPLSFVLGLLTGVNTLVAQGVGGDRRESTGAAFWHGLYLAFMAAGTMLLLSPLAPVLIRLAGPSVAVGELSSGYLEVRLAGTFGMALLLVAEGFYRGLGRTSTPMWCGFVQLLLNAGFNYTLIFGHFGLPALGVKGAAIGTVAAQTLVGAVMLISIFRSSEFERRHAARSQWRFRHRELIRLLRVSWPIGVQTFMEMGGITVFCASIARLGDAQLAASNAVLQAWSFAYMGAAALAVGATTLVGQSIGAGDTGRADISRRRVLVVGYWYTAAIGVVYVFFPTKLMELILREGDLQQVLPFAKPLFVVVVICLIFDLEFNILSGVLRGAGDTRYPMVVNIVSAWLVFVPAVIVISPRFGVTGAWSCLILHVAVMAFFLRRRIRSGRWLRISLPVEDSIVQQRAA